MGLKHISHNLNTSNVKVQQRENVKKGVSQTNLNTSNVKVQRSYRIL